MQKLMGDEGWGGGPCFSLLTPSVCGLAVSDMWNELLHKRSATKLLVNFQTLKTAVWFASSSSTRVFHDAHFCAFWRTFGPNDPNNYHYCVMVDAKLCAQHLLLKRMIQIDVGAICYLRVSTTRTWVRIADIGDETVDCVSVQFFASKRQTLCIHYWYAINQSTKMSRS